MDIKIKYNTIIVKDMEESIKFYTDIMGFEIDSQYHLGPNGMITLMKGSGDVMIELIANSAYEVGFYSVGLDVKDLNAVLNEFRSKGGKITMEPMTTTVGSMAFAEDPNGVKFALIQHN